VIDMATWLSSRSLLSPVIPPGELDGGAHKAVRGRVRLRNPLLVIEEPLFRDILIREWRRADRFDQSFVLVLLESRSSSTSWAPIIEALTSVKHETDVTGWFEDGRVLGLLRPDSDGSTCAAREVEQQIRRELERRLEIRAGSLLSISVHVPAVVEPPLNASGADPVFEELRGSRRHSALRDIAKRTLDIVGSLALLLVLSPLLLLIALLVKVTSRGPIFFRQVRVGVSGKPFTMFKFRTMHMDADHGLHRQFVTEFINAGAAANPSGDSGLFKIVNDPRVTFVGRLLRKSSLDELPQLWNVLRGDMSLVGPRPPLSYEVEQYKRWHYRRVLEAKPGITGLWQVAGRSRTNFDDMVRLDLQYVQNQSAWTDIKILLATPRAVISGKGAC
jgi:lipopolysaccharide/colanic/teichoic acid biosynthesis glycosyltransferase